MTNPRNIFGWHIAASDLVNASMSDVCDTSAVIKVLVEPHSVGALRDINVKAQGRARIVARLINVDQEERELHARAYRREDPGIVGRWYADVIAAIAIPGNLHFVIWESGPNELNAEGDPWWAKYCLAFLHAMRRHGLRCALGGFSYGRPKLPHYDGIDEWVTGGWLPVMEAIHRANVAPRHEGEGPEPVAYFYLHEYSDPDDVSQAIPFNIRRYLYLYETHVLPKAWFVPLLITEWNYAQPRASLPGTDERIRQMLELNDILSVDRFLVGIAVYFLANREEGPFDVRPLVVPYAQAMRTGGYVVEHPTGPGIIEVPPDPDDTPLPPIPPPTPPDIIYRIIPLENANFEGEFDKETADLTVPRPWKVWANYGLERIHSEPERHPPHVAEGEVCARLWVSNEERVFGYYQRVSVPVGALVEFTILGRAWSTNNPEVGTPSDGPSAMIVGIDPHGGTDANMAEWGLHTEAMDAFVKLTSARVVAKADHVTVFIKGDVQEARVRSDFWWDRAELVQIIAASTPPVPPAPPMPDGYEEGRVTADGLRLRVAPSLNGPIIYQLRRDTIVKIIGQKGEWCLVEVTIPMIWYQVNWPVLLRGYSHSSYIRRIE